MSIETELRGARRPEVELDAEQDVDFGRYLRAVAARWWLVPAGLVLGLVVGWLVSTGGGRPYEASAIVYLGQPFAPGGTTPIQNLPTKVGFAGQIVLSQSTIKRVSKQVGLRPEKLRQSVSTKPITGLTRGRVEQPAPLINVTVKNPSATKTVAAANALASIVVADFSTYVDVKLGTYQRRFARAERELNEVHKRIAEAQQQQAAVLKDKTIPATEKLIVLANFNNVLNFNELRRANLEQAQLTLRDQIAFGQQIEKARVQEPAVARRVPAPSRRSAAAIGAVIGLLLGVVAALLWEPVAARARSRSEV